MANDEAMKIDERIGRLELTVAKGFFEQGQRIGGLEGRMGSLEGRMGGLEDRMDALSAKFDVTTDAVLDAIKTVLERIDGLGEQMERSTAAIRKRHAADRRLTDSVLGDHKRRILALERRGTSSPIEGT